MTKKGTVGELIKSLSKLDKNARISIVVEADNYRAFSESMLLYVKKPRGYSGFILNHSPEKLSFIGGTPCL